MQAYHKLVAKYGENHFITIDLINEKNTLGIKSDEIVNNMWYNNLYKSEENRAMNMDLGKALKTLREKRAFPCAG